MDTQTSLSALRAHLEAAQAAEMAAEREAQV